MDDQNAGAKRDVRDLEIQSLLIKITDSLAKNKHTLDTKLRARALAQRVRKESEKDQIVVPSSLLEEAEKLLSRLTKLGYFDPQCLVSVVNAKQHEAISQKKIKKHGLKFRKKSKRQKIKAVPPKLSIIYTAFESSRRRH